MKSRIRARAHSSRITRGKIFQQGSMLYYGTILYYIVLSCLQISSSNNVHPFFKQLVASTSRQNYFLVVALTVQHSAVSVGSNTASCCKSYDVINPPCSWNIQRNRSTRNGLRRSTRSWSNPIDKPKSYLMTTRDTLTGDRNDEKAFDKRAPDVVESKGYVVEGNFNESNGQIGHRSFRTVAEVEKFARLPVWPVWNGVFLWMIGKLFGLETASYLEQNGFKFIGDSHVFQLGGRVCPNFFNPPHKTSPFIMLVHHCHSFAMWDLVRYIQRTFFPEGFPSHPHRGFTTVTYILKGGFRHRDSLGIEQKYGADDAHSLHQQSPSPSSSSSRYNGKHTQWLFTGSGLLHEEMWDIHFKNFFQPSHQELYQIWLNVPARHKLDNPSVELLGGPDQTPTVFTYFINDSNGTKKMLSLSDADGTEDEANNIAREKQGMSLQSTTLIIAGEHDGYRASIQNQQRSYFSNIQILHIRIEPGATWTHSLPLEYKTAIIYVRMGNVEILAEKKEKNAAVPPHHTAYLSPIGKELWVKNPSSTDVADFMLLAGEPLNEPVAAQGSMVMNSYQEINVAYQDYQLGKMGVPWDHKLSNEEWHKHIQKNPSLYKFDNRHSEGN